MKMDILQKGLAEGEDSLPSGHLPLDGAWIKRSQERAMLPAYFCLFFQASVFIAAYWHPLSTAGSRLYILLSPLNTSN